MTVSIFKNQLAEALQEKVAIEQRIQELEAIDSKVNTSIQPLIDILPQIRQLGSVEDFKAALLNLLDESVTVPADAPTEVPTEVVHDLYTDVHTEEVDSEPLAVPAVESNDEEEFISQVKSHYVEVLGLQHLTDDQINLKSIKQELTRRSKDIPQLKIFNLSATGADFYKRVDSWLKVYENINISPKETQQPVSDAPLQVGDRVLINAKRPNNNHYDGKIGKVCKITDKYVFAQFEPALAEVLFNPDEVSLAN